MEFVVIVDHMICDKEANREILESGPDSKDLDIRYVMYHLNNMQSVYLFVSPFLC